MNKSVDLIVRPEAEEDIQAAFQYYEVCSKGLGSDFVLSVDAILSLIQRNPEIFPKIYKDILVDCSNGSPTLCFISLKKRELS